MMSCQRYFKLIFTFYYAHIDLFKSKNVHFLSALKWQVININIYNFTYKVETRNIPVPIVLKNALIENIGGSWLQKIIVK